MPDITMCGGVRKEDGAVCSMRDSCYRFRATPSEYRQSYFVSAPFVAESKQDVSSCGHFWEIESKSKYKRLEILVK